MPVPALLNETAPLPSWIIPEKRVEPLLPPAVKVMIHTSAFDADAVEGRLKEFASLVAAKTLKIH